MKQIRTKDQHTVPNTYLKHFTNEKGKLITYNLKKNVFQEKKPENTTIMRNFYTLKKTNGENDYRVENWMGNTFENDYDKVIEKLNRNGKLDWKDKYILSSFSSFQFARTVKFRNFYYENMEGLIKNLNYRSLLEQNPNIDDIVQTLQTNFGIQFNDMNKTEIEECVQKKEYDLKLHKNEKIKNEAIKCMVDIAQAFTEDLLKLNWYILESSNNSCFITSDNPFILPGYEEFSGFDEKYKIKGKVIPLTSKYCLFITGLGNDLKRGQLDDGATWAINLNIAFCAKNLIISNNKALIEKLNAELFNKQ